MGRSVDERILLKLVFKIPCWECYLDSSSSEYGPMASRYGLSDSIQAEYFCISLLTDKVRSSQNITCPKK